MEQRLLVTWLTDSIHGAETFLRRSQLHSYSRMSQHFMEPEDSLSCSQEPSTCPCPQSDQSSLYHSHINPAKIHLKIIHPPMLWSSYWPLSFWLSHQNSMCIPITGCSTGQEISRLLWCPEIHYHAYKSPPLVLILSQMNLVNLSHLIFLRSSLVIFFPSR
jgi:hypothetical protein